MEVVAGVSKYALGISREEEDLGAQGPFCSTREKAGISNIATKGPL